MLNDRLTLLGFTNFTKQPPTTVVYWSLIVESTQSWYIPMRCNSAMILLSEDVESGSASVHVRVS